VPQDADLLTLLGAARHRAGRDAEVAASLLKAIDVGGRFPIRQYAFLMLALQHFGNATEAHAMADVHRGLMQDFFTAIDRECQMLAAEVAGSVE
jgi:hypothetical protein